LCAFVNFVSFVIKKKNSVLKKIQNIVILGSGKVATQLGQRLKDRGLTILQVYSRNLENAQKLSTTLQCNCTNNINAIITDAHLYIIAVSDDAIVPLAASLSEHLKYNLVVHTSGATDSIVLAPYFTHYGVFYPLQSFSGTKKIVWSKIPLCIDAPNKHNEVLLKKLSKQIGTKTMLLNDSQKANLHVAAVFANNFTNHCLAIAEQLLKDNQLPFDLLFPLITATFEKVLNDSPTNVQTGPAIRGDSKTIEKHLNLLEKETFPYDIYQLMSESIRNTNL
jgi:predicted short-subunit dehydrogenase-like oxidoreductase (DUF2520 family)